MKKIFALILCILLLSGCAATYDGPTKGEYVLTEYTTTHYSFLGEVYTNRSVYAYDIYGNRVQTMEYRDGELATVSNLRYDKSGNETSRTTWDHTGWIPMFDSRIKQTYDDQGRLLSYVSYNFWGKETGGSWYTYDDEAGIRTWHNGAGDTQTTWLDENGNTIREVAGEYETIYEYDENGNRIGWTSYQNGVFFERYAARYDDQNRQIWGGRYNAAGDLESQTTYEYDALGRTVSSGKFDGQGQTQGKTTYAFDDETHTRTTHRADGWIRIEYYDADGRIHLIEDYDNEGNLSMVQQYTYQEIQVPADREE